MWEDEVKRHKLKVKALWMFFFAILFAVSRDIYLVYDCQKANGDWDPKKRICTPVEVKDATSNEEVAPKSITQ